LRSFVPLPEAPAPTKHWEEVEGDVAGHGSGVRRIGVGRLDRVEAHGDIQVEEAEEERRVAGAAEEGAPSVMMQRKEAHAAEMRTSAAGQAIRRKVSSGGRQ
jgi:hypothetical protein